MEIEEANKEIEECPETIFDTFDFSINEKLAGASLKARLMELSNLYGRISKLSSNAILLHEQAKNRRDRVESHAWGLIDRSLSATKGRLIVKSTRVTIEGVPTDLGEEEERVAIYEYIARRGKDKMKEIKDILDVGRSLLSWDKEEHSSTKY